MMQIYVILFFLYLFCHHLARYSLLVQKMYHRKVNKHKCCAGLKKYSTYEPLNKTHSSVVKQPASENFFTEVN
jgi:hypothetical protein